MNVTGWRKSSFGGTQTEAWAADGLRETQTPGRNLKRMRKPMCWAKRIDPSCTSHSPLGTPVGNRDNRWLRFLRYCGLKCLNWGNQGRRDTALSRFSCWLFHRHSWVSCMGLLGDTDRGAQARVLPASLEEGIYLCFYRARPEGPRGMQAFNVVL